MRSRVGRRVLSALARTVVVAVLASLLAPSVAMAASNPYASHVVFIRAGNVWVCAADGKSAKRLTSDGTASNPRWAANHKDIYFVDGASSGSAIRRVRASGGTAVTVPVPDPEFGGSAMRNFSAVGPTSDGKYLFVGDTVELGEFTTVARILRYTISTKAAKVVATDTPLTWNHNYGHIDATSDGKRLVVVRFEGDTSQLLRYTIATRAWKTLSSSGLSGRLSTKDELLMSDWPDRRATALRRMTLAGKTVKTLKSLKGLTPDRYWPYEAFGYGPGNARVLYGRNLVLYTMPRAGGSARKIATNAQMADW